MDAKINEEKKGLVSDVEGAAPSVAKESSMLATQARAGRQPGVCSEMHATSHEW